MMRQDTSSVDSVVAGVQGGVDDLTISTPTPTTTLPPCPGGLFNFPEGTMEVTDADEEIMELYMDLATTSPESRPTTSSGLGFLDSTKSVLELELILSPSPVGGSRRDRLGLLDGSSVVDGTATPSTNGKGRQKGSALRKSREKEKDTDKEKGKEKEVVIGVKVQQDLTALKGRKGDTGSVLWRSSLHLATHLLTQTHFQPLPPNLPLLNPQALRTSHILELGAGTGVLAVLLHKLCRAYTASDRWENLKLIQRNLELNGVELGVPQGVSHSTPDASERLLNHTAQATSSKLASTPTPTAMTRSARHTGDTLDQGVNASTKNVHPSRVELEEIDWETISSQAQAQAQAQARKRRQRDHAAVSVTVTNAPDATGSKLRSQTHNSFTIQEDRLRVEDNDRTERAGVVTTDHYEGKYQYDLILAVDCIYNESLVGPLVDTIAEYAACGAVVWVVVELRSSDVLTLFLETWLNHPSGPWRIIRLAEGAMGSWAGRRGRWVGWVGWAAGV